MEPDIFFIAQPPDCGQDRLIAFLASDDLPLYVRSQIEVIRADAVRIWKLLVKHLKDPRNGGVKLLYGLGNYHFSLTPDYGFRLHTKFTKSDLLDPERTSVHLPGAPVSLSGPSSL